MQAPLSQKKSKKKNKIYMIELVKIVALEKAISTVEFYPCNGNMNLHDRDLMDALKLANSSKTFLHISFKPKVKWKVLTISKFQTQIYKRNWYYVNKHFQLNWLTTKISIDFLPHQDWFSFPRKIMDFSKEMSNNHENDECKNWFSDTKNKKQ